MSNRGGGSELEDRLRDIFHKSIRSGKVSGYDSIFRLLDVNEGGRVSKMELVSGLDKSFKEDISIKEADLMVEKISAAVGFSLEQFLEYFEGDSHKVILRYYEYLYKQKYDY